MSSGRLVELLDSVERRVELMRSAVQALEVEKDTLVELLHNFPNSPELQKVSVVIQPMCYQKEVACPLAIGVVGFRCRQI